MADVARLDLGRVRGASRKKKASKAVNEVKRLITQRTGQEDVRISPRLNERLWDRGARSPPHSIDVQLVDHEDHVRVEPADVELEETQEDVIEDEGAEEAKEEAEEASEDDERMFDSLPDDVKETLRDGTIGEGKDAVQDLNKADFELLLDFEEKHQNRKGMKTFLRSNMR